MVTAATPPYAELLDLEAIRTEKAGRHLRDFVRELWHVVEPFTPYSHNWHIDALSDHLEATTTGDIRDLLVTVPPRTMKSLTISVFFPAWAWIDHPYLRFLYASYAMRLSSEHSQATRSVIESDYYQARWGDRFELADDDNLKTQFSNTAKGKRSATSVGSSLTGLGGDILVADDPHNVQERESDAIRTATVDWWNKSMSTRHNTPATGVRIVVQQRVHDKDVAGAVIESGDYVHLNLPMEYEPTPFFSPIGWRDPRTETGELLWPERMDAAFVAKQKRTLGSYDYASQYQQRPVPAEGGILKEHWFGVYEMLPPSATTIIQSWDTAFKTAKTNDYSVCVTFAYGITGINIIDVYRERLEYPDLERAVKTQARRYRPTAVLIEDKGSGQSLLQSLRRASDFTWTVIAITASRPDEKLQRAHDVSPAIEAGEVSLPEHAPWRADAISELVTFPLADHDDIFDAITQGIAWIKRQGMAGGGTSSWVKRTADDDDEEDDRW